MDPTNTNAHFVESQEFPTIEALIDSPYEKTSSFLSSFPSPSQNEYALSSEITERRIYKPDTLEINQPHLQFKTIYGTIDYIRTGKRSNQTLLFIPGNPDQNYTFHRLIQFLAPHFDIVAISPPGKGFSNYSEAFDFKLSSYAQFWKIAIRLLNLSRITVVAFSFGLAEILHALLLFGKEELRVEKIISLCGWSPALLPELLPHSLTNIFLGSREGLFFYRRLWNNKFFGIESTFYKSFHRWIPEGEMFALTQQYFSSWPKHYEINKPYGKKILKGICKSVRTQSRLNSSVSEYYEKQKRNLYKLRGIPILAIGASHDKFIRGPQDKKPRGRQGVDLRFTDKKGLTYTDRLFHALSRATGYIRANRVVHIPESGHMVALEAPQEVAGAILQFMRSFASPKNRKPSLGFRLHGYLRSLDDRLFPGT